VGPTEFGARPSERADTLPWPAHERKPFTENGLFRH